jgi:hypothetical protein
VLFATIAAFMPKCPLCIAAYLGAIGLSGLAARVDPRALWLAGAAAMALVAAPVAAIVVKVVLAPALQMARRRLRRTDPSRSASETKGEIRWRQATRKPRNAGMDTPR